MITGKKYMGTSSETDALEAQIRESYGKVVWTHKTHEKCADILISRLNRVKYSQIILSAIITTGILITVFGKSQFIGIVTAVLSFLLTLVNTYLKEYDLGGMAQKHADAAIALWRIREEYLSILTDMYSLNSDCNDLRERRNSLNNDLQKLYKGSPRTFSKAYNQASIALKEQEELTFSEEEIDKMLPKPMRKSDHK